MEEIVCRFVYSNIAENIVMIGFADQEGALLFIPAASAPSPAARFSLQGDSGRSARLKSMWRAGPRRYKSKRAQPHSAGTIERRSDPLTSE